MDTYEKKYKEAQKWVESIYPNLSHEQQMEAEAFFPELCESEDEKIRRSLIHLVHLYGGEFGMIDTNTTVEKAITWLEKQGKEDSSIQQAYEWGYTEGKRIERKHWVEKQKFSEDYNSIDPQFGKPIEQNHAWSEEDDKMYNSLTEFEKAVKQVMEEAIECGDTHNLKADADMLLRLTQKPWSEKDEKILKAIHNSVDVECLSKNELDYVVMVDWFNALKDRVQPKQEWSEEDATHYNRILKELNLQKEMPINASVIKEVKSDIIWFKSLRPQNTWKPSDEQITVLELASKYERVFTPKQIDILIDLKEQLKKLRGE